MFEVLCCPAKHTAVSVTGGVTVACRGAGVLKTRLWLCDSFRPSETVPGQAAVCAERTADLHRQSSGPRPASTAQSTLTSSSSSDLFPAGGAGVSLPPRLSNQLPGDRTAARLRPQCTSATALVEYVSARRSTHLASYTIGDRDFPAAAASVWNSLPQSVRASPSLPVFCSRLKTELFAWSYSSSE